MDELDLLLEELALNPSGSGSKLSSDNFSEPAKNVKNPQNVYSAPPGSLDATQRNVSPTVELDSILEDLLSLAQQEEERKESPPPEELSLKKRDEPSQQETSNNEPKMPPSNSIKTDSIDELLGGLTSDLQKIGVKTTPKGHCAACQKIIVGKIITALGETWHPEHFVCSVCKMELSTVGFFEREGRPYCSKDYHEQFSPRCAYCKGAILQNILTALDQTWHPEHFFCTHCGDPFGSDGFLEKDGKPYCCKDFYHLFAPKCSGCGEPVRANYLTAANGTWHPECFVCADCLTPFTGGVFMELDGRALCPRHFHSRQGTLCGSCGEPITGRCISALSQKFHPEHFVCAFCLRQLSQGIFKEQKGKPYCITCFNKLFL